MVSNGSDQPAVANVIRAIVVTMKHIAIRRADTQTAKKEKKNNIVTASLKSFLHV